MISKMHRDDTHIDFLDAMRGVAILGVFVFHCYARAYAEDPTLWTGWLLTPPGGLPFLLVYPASFGGLGVAMFFVVSGFCIHLSHQRSRRKDMTTFFTRRFFRIYPPYFVALTIFVLRDHFKGGHADSLGQVISHYFLFNNYSTEWFFGINPAYWSIAVEVQLYLLYPLLLFLVGRLTWMRTMWLLAALEVSLRIVACIYFIHNQEPPRLLAGSPFFFWFSWSIGAYAAEAFLNRRPLPFSTIPIWIFPVATIIAGSIKPLLGSFTFLFAALSTVCFMNLFLTNPSAKRLAATPIFARYLGFMGIVSYSAYLLHHRLLESVAYFFRTLPHIHFSRISILLLTLPSWIPILIISWCFYRLFELPSIWLGKRFLQSWYKDKVVVVQKEPTPADGGL